MEQYIIDYRNKMERLEQETGEVRIARVATNPVDGSSYQKFVKGDTVRNKVNISQFINDDTYLISDVHFGKDFENDKKNIRILKKVPKDATIIFLGDIGYVKTACREYIAECFKQIKVKNRFLVLGNHDCYELDFYYNELGMRGVYEYIYLIDKNYVLTHQPADGPRPNMINFHGHIHEETDYIKVTDVQWKINVWEGYCMNRVKTLKEWYDDNYNNPKTKVLVR